MQLQPLSHASGDTAPWGAVAETPVLLACLSGAGESTLVQFWPTPVAVVLLLQQLWCILASHCVEARVPATTLALSVGGLDGNEGAASLRCLPLLAVLC